MALKWKGKMLRRQRTRSFFSGRQRETKPHRERRPRFLMNVFYDHFSTRMHAGTSMDVMSRPRVRKGGKKIGEEWGGGSRQERRTSEREYHAIETSTTRYFLFLDHFATLSAWREPIADFRYQHSLSYWKWMENSYFGYHRTFFQPKSKEPTV